MVSGKVTQVIKDWSSLSLLQYAKKLVEMARARNKRILELEQELNRLRTLQNNVEFLLERVNSNQLKVFVSLRSSVAALNGKTWTPKPEYLAWANGRGKVINCYYSSSAVTQEDKPYDYGEYFKRWHLPKAYTDLLKYFGGYNN